jgi:hypothetical protein
MNLDKTSTHVAIMAIDAYRITDKDIHELYELYHRRENVFNHIFEFSINENKGGNNQPIITEYYHQFVGQVIDEDNPKEFICFDVTTNDNLLHEEICQCGVEDLFQGIDFKRMLETSYIEPYETYFKKLGRPQYFLVQIDYMGSYDYHHGGYEYDMEIDVIGYLDANYEKILFENKKK